MYMYFFCILSKNLGLLRRTQLHVHETCLFQQICQIDSMVSECTLPQDETKLYFFPSGEPIK